MPVPFLQSIKVRLSTNLTNAYQRIVYEISLKKTDTDMGNLLLIQVFGYT